MSTQMACFTHAAAELCLHEQEGVIVQVAVVVHIWLHAPVEVKIQQEGMPLEEPAEVPAHAETAEPGALWLKGAARHQNFCAEGYDATRNQEFRSSVFLDTAALTNQQELSMPAGALPAHVMVGLSVSIQHAPLPHSLPCSCCAALIHPGRIAPVLWWYQAIQCPC